MERNDAVAASSAEARRAFYERIGALGMTPLWEVLGALVPPQPTSPVAPALWHYDQVREHVMEAGRLITADVRSPRRALDGFSNYAQVTNLIDRLGARGYTDADIRKILGENYLRVFAQVWR